MCVCKVSICNLSLHHPAHLPDNVNGTGRGLSHTMLITTAASVAAAFVVLTLVIVVPISTYILIKWCRQQKKMVISNPKPCGR